MSESIYCDSCASKDARIKELEEGMNIFSGVAVFAAKEISKAHEDKLEWMNRCGELMDKIKEYTNE